MIWFFVVSGIVAMLLVFVATKRREICGNCGKRMDVDFLPWGDQKLLGVCNRCGIEYWGVDE